MRTDSINKAVSSFEYNEISLEEEGKFSVNTRFAAGAAFTHALRWRKLYRVCGSDDDNGSEDTDAFSWKVGGCVG